eukprot:1277719-Rhodomonas_salina.4
MNTFLVARRTWSAGTTPPIQYRTSRTARVAQYNAGPVLDRDISYDASSPMGSTGSVHCRLYVIQRRVHLVGAQPTLVPKLA